MDAPSNLASLRTWPDVNPYPVHALAYAQVAPGFDGVVVLWQVPAPPGSSERAFKIMLNASAAAGAFAFIPGAPDVCLVDYKQGFVVSPETLQPFIHQFWKSQPAERPLPGDPPVVT